MLSLRESLLTIYNQLVPDDRNPNHADFWKENLLIDSQPTVDDLSTMVGQFSAWLSPFEPTTSKALSRLHEQIQGTLNPVFSTELRSAGTTWYPVKSRSSLNPSAEPFSPKGFSLSKPLKEFCANSRWRELIKKKNIMVMSGPHAGAIGRLTYWDKIGAWVKLKNQDSVFVFDKHIVSVLKE